MPTTNEQIVLDVQNNLDESIKQLGGLSKELDKTSKSGENLSTTFIRTEQKLTGLTTRLDRAKKTMKGIDFPTMAKNMPIKSFQRLSGEVERFQEQMKDLASIDDPKELEKRIRSLNILADKINATATQYDSYNKALKDTVKSNDKLRESQTEVVTSLRPEEIANYTQKIKALEIAEEELQKTTANIETPKGQEKFQKISAKIKTLQSETETIITKATKETKKQAEFAKDLEDERKKIFKNVKAEAKIASERNKELRKQIKTQEKGIGGLAARFKLWKKNVPNAAMAKFGRLGVVAGKAMKGLGKAMMGIPGLGALLALGGLIAALAMADKRIKGMRKSIIALSAESGEWEKNVSATGKIYTKVGSKIDNIRKKNENLARRLRTTPETIHEWEKALIGVGFKLDETSKNLRDVSAISTRLGMQFETMGALFGQVREELGQGFDETENALVNLIDNAEESGMTMSRFYNKVINAASGLGIYGTKLVDVGELFADLKKNMELPEKAASELAENMIKGFKEMSVEQKMMIVQNSKFEESFNDAMKAATSGDFAKLATVTGKSAEKAEKMFQSFKKLPATTDRAVRALMASDPAKQFQARAEKFLGAMGVDISSDINTINEKIGQKSLLELKGLGEAFGFNTEESVIGFQKLIEGLAKNEKAFSDLGQSSAKQDAETRKAQLKKMDEQIKRQTQPVTDAIEQGITQVLNDIYTVLSSAFNFISPLIAKISIAIKSGFGRLLGVMSFSKGLQKKGLDIQIKAAQDSAKLEMELAAKREQQIDKEQKSIVGELQTLKAGEQDKKTRKRIEKLEERLVENQKELVASRKEYKKANEILDRFEKTSKIAEGAGESKKDIKKIKQDLFVAREFKRFMKEMGGGKVEGEVNFEGDIKGIVKDIVKLHGTSPIQAIAADALQFDKPLKAELSGPLTAVEPRVVSIDEPTEPPIPTPALTDLQTIENIEQKIIAGPIEPTPETGPEVPNVADTITTPDGAVPEEGVVPKGGTGETINDNRTINIHVNHRDKDYIIQLVRNELWNDKKAS